MCSDQMILWKSKLLYMKGKTSRDDRLQVRTLGHRRHKNPGRKQCLRSLGNLGSQVKGDPEAQRLGVPEQVKQPSESRFGE